MPITMPGLTSNMDVKGIIKKMMMLKRLPIKRIEKEIEDLNLKKEIWKTTRKKLDELANAAKRLFDYTNPFREMLAKSSLKESFTAIAGRKAKKSKREIKVIRLATAHRLISDSIIKTKNLKGCIFYIKCKDKEEKVDFSLGGNIKDLALAIETSAKKVVRVVLTYDTTETAILMLESQKTGAKYGLSFRGDLSTLFNIGLLTKSKADSFVHKMGNKSNYTKYSGISGSYNSLFELRSGILSLKPGSRIEMPLSKVLETGKGYVIELEIKLSGEAAPITKTNTVNLQTFDPSKVNLGQNDPVNIEDIKIFGTKLIPNEKKPKKIKKKKVETKLKKIVFNNDKVFALIEVEGISRKEYKVSVKDKFDVWQKIKVDIDSADNLKSITKLGFLNDNKNVIVSYRKITVISKKKDGTVGKNILQYPRDSILTIDGVKVKRETNAIDDLIDGVTLKLLNPGKKGNLIIDHDFELITKDIYAFVSLYNKTLVYLNAISKHISRDDLERIKKRRAKMNDLAKALEDKSKTLIEKHKGLLSGDMTLSRLKNRVRILIMSPYKTRLSRQLALLMQIGISTGKAGARWADLKDNFGTLELDTTKLKKIIQKDVIAVSQLFGNDTTGNNIIDSGLCFSLHKFLKVYTRPGNAGIIAVKMKYFERIIKDKGKSRDREERFAKAYEVRLRRRFTSMETKINEYKSKSRWLNNYGKGDKK